jgi:phospholipase C
MAARAGHLDAIEHFVVLMLACRSFDHMLGYLYTEQGNVTPAGHSFEGLTGAESNPDSSGEPVTVFRIEPTTPNAYFMPGANPGEGYNATNNQLFGAQAAPSDPSQSPTNSGFVRNFGDTLRWQGEQGRLVRAGATAHDIMGCFTPQALPVLSSLARGFAVCDYWYASAPTETLPNRAFACAATSQGHMDDRTHTFTSPSIFGLLESHQIGWAIYGYDRAPLTKAMFSDANSAPASRFGTFPDFLAACAAGSLPAFCFLEPSWGSAGNSQHPPYDVALGEQLIYDVYQAVRAGPAWPQTLLVITYDHHGGCYDHVPPPPGAVPPDESPGEFGFDFTRFGVRVPAVLVSPLIPPGTVFRVPARSVPLDHTSILKTVEERWSLPALTRRDAAAPGFGDVLTLRTPRTDDVLAGVSAPDGAAVIADSEATQTTTAGDRPRRRRRRGASADSEIPETTPEAGADGDGTAGEAAARQLPPKAQLTTDSWTIDDKLGYEAYADAIAAFIRHPDTEPPLTIGIKGPWGSGKTSLMRMVEQKLDPRPENGEPQRIPLDPNSREKVSPGRWRRSGPRGESHPPRVSNREVLKKADQPHPGPAAEPSLATEPPAGERDMPQGAGAWRPTVWFNPWMYQSGEQIWAGFAYEIITQVTRRLPLGDRERFWLRLNLARFDREVVRRRAYRLLLERLVPVVLAGAAIAVLALTALIVARLAPHLASSLHRAAAAVLSVGTLGVLAGAIIQSIRFAGQSASVGFGGLVNEPAMLAQGARTETTGLFTGAVADPDYHSRTGFLHLVNTDMRRVLDIFATPSRPLVVFVDDLDRCSPGAVVQVIEAINLFLAGEFRNCIFVLAMEPDVVAADIEVAYQAQMARLNNRPAAHGWDTLGWRFLDKIVQLPLSLPPVGKQLRTTFVRGLLNVPAGPTAGSQVVTPVPGSPPADGQPGGQVDAGSPVTATPSDARPASPAPLPGASSDDQPRDGTLAAPDAKEIAEIEKQIRDKHPDQKSLRSIAQGVQDARLGRSQPLTEATIAAVNRVFADLYSDQQAFEAIESALPELGSTNPREIKRYINLFRFYKFIAYRKHLDGAPDTPDEEIARLATLVIRWPDLVSVLMMPGEDGQTNLTALTRVAVETASATGGSVKIEAWVHLLVHIGLQTGDAYQAGRWDDLRCFLAAAQGIAEVAERFI